jgi:hypothetical protein
MIDVMSLILIDVAIVYGGLVIFNTILDCKFKNSYFKSNLIYDKLLIYAIMKYSFTTGMLVAVMTVILSGTLLASPLLSSVDAKSTDPRLFPSSVNKALSVKWWTWLFSIPQSSNPITDDNPCDVKQKGLFFYLVGTFGGSAERNCTIQKNKAIFFPIVNVIATLDPTPEFNTIDKLKIAAAGFIDQATDLQASVDGVEIKDLKSLRAQSPPFKVKDNFTPDGILTGVSDGYWVPLKPLSVGEHTIHFAAKGPVDLDVTYHITVK